MGVNEYLVQVGVWVVTSGLKIGLIFILLLTGLKFSSLAAEKIFRTLSRKNRDDVEFHKRADTMSGIIRSALKVAIFLLAAVMILGELGIQIGPIMAAAGVIGVAIGFGAKTLVEDVISGFFILLEDQIRVGDVVQINDKGGLVEKVNLRMVILRDLAGNVHYVRNGLIDIVTNMTKEYSRYVFDIGVAYRENVDEVIALIKEVDEEMRNDEVFRHDILEPIEVLGLDQFADSAVVIKARTKTRPIKQWTVAREFNKRLKTKFDEHGIEIPFPHRTVYFGADKRGDAPAAPVRLQEKPVLASLAVEGAQRTFSYSIDKDLPAHFPPKRSSQP